jgi:uncharacterized protein (TIGR02391 family)
MQLQNEINKEMWDIIQTNYNKENYTGAIIDAFFFLTETIRNKTGLEGDGASLIGQAFEKNNPLIKLNSLQTDSDQDEQRGIETILRGIYQGIRNPRSHDKQIDNKKEVDKIIIFIDYLLEKIDDSKASFSEEKIYEVVGDKHFVQNEEYSKLLVKEIPKRQVCNMIINLILKRTSFDIYNLGFFMNALFEEICENDIARIYKIISQELKLTNDDTEIRTIIHICPEKYWDRIDKVVRIRVEEIILQDVKKGMYSKESKKCLSGYLGTWVKDELFDKFSNKEDFNYYLSIKIKNGSKEEIDYVLEYYGNKLISMNRDKMSGFLEIALKSKLKENDEEIINYVKYEIAFNSKHIWWEILKDELKDIEDIMKTKTDLPF